MQVLRDQSDLYEAMQEYAVQHGAITLRDDAMAKVREGLTTVEEALRATVSTE